MAGFNSTVRSRRNSPVRWCAAFFVASLLVGCSATGDVGPTPTVVAVEAATFLADALVRASATPAEAGKWEITARRELASASAVAGGLTESHVTVRVAFAPKTGWLAAAKSADVDRLLKAVRAEVESGVTARSATVRSSNDDEDGGHARGFQVEYTKGPSHGSINARLSPPSGSGDYELTIYLHEFAR